MNQYARFKKWLNSPLDQIALELVGYSIHQSEHDFLDFKQDFYLERRYQKDKGKSEGLTKEGITHLLERYCVAFANTHGGFLVVGVAEQKKGFFIKGINFKNMKRRKMISYIQSEQKRIHKQLGIEFVFISMIIGNKELLVFQIPEGKEKPYISSDGKKYYRIADNTLFK